MPSRRRTLSHQVGDPERSHQRFVLCDVIEKRLVAVELFFRVTKTGVDQQTDAKGEEERHRKNEVLRSKRIPFLLRLQCSVEEEATSGGSGGTVRGREEVAAALTVPPELVGVASSLRWTEEITISEEAKTAKRYDILDISLIGREGKFASFAFVTSLPREAR